MDSEGRLEEAFSKKNQMETDWDRLCEMTKEKHRVVTFLTGRSSAIVDLYSKMGDVVVVPQNSSAVITAAMMAVLLQLIGQPTEHEVAFHRKNHQTSFIEKSQETEVEVPIKLEDIMKTADPPT
ncbi:expressed unknown protein [Seminavis robusta]|uniref:Uncharacterized protein n=1 Tax=Seminavis robusta TaxID=568900 RepID=A0A9N8DYQ6_9STRA|nr:expressed unknown protein [Seminavis robusta]|eukprot:Sro374_g129340.1 n/a (124) ;mRNA; r:66712-67083